MLDNNPAFDLINVTHKRAVRIIQESSTSVNNYAVWLNKFGDRGIAQDEVVEEMVFTYKSHETSAEIFAELFTMWSNLDTSYEDMEKIIAIYSEK